MVLRFKGMPLMADILRRHVDEVIAGVVGPDGFCENGVCHTAFSIKEHFHVQPDGDLFVDDDFDPEITGMLLQCLRAHKYLIENAEIIVPKKYKDVSDDSMSFALKKDAPGNDNILRFEDHLPDSAFDDGNYEKEMLEFEERHRDDEE